MHDMSNAILKMCKAMQENRNSESNEKYDHMIKVCTFLARKFSHKQLPCSKKYIFVGNYLQ